MNDFEMTILDTSVPDIAADDPTPVARPTVRWGAIVWAVLFGATAALSLWIMIDPARRETAGEWLTTLSPLTATLYVMLALGVLIVVFGLVALIRRGERDRRRTG